jgi:hypothetical protein
MPYGALYIYIYIYMFLFNRAFLDKIVNPLSYHLFYFSKTYSPPYFSLSLRSKGRSSTIGLGPFPLLKYYLIYNKYFFGGAGVCLPLDGSFESPTTTTYRCNVMTMTALSGSMEMDEHNETAITPWMEQILEDLTILK